MHGYDTIWKSKCQAFFQDFLQSFAPVFVYNRDFYCGQLSSLCGQANAVPGQDFSGPGTLRDILYYIMYTLTGGVAFHPRIFLHLKNTLIRRSLISGGGYRIVMVKPPNEKEDIL